MRATRQMRRGTGAYSSCPPFPNIDDGCNVYHKVRAERPEPCVRRKQQLLLFVARQLTQNLSNHRNTREATMKRREFIALLSIAAAAFPLTAPARQPRPPSPVREDWLDRRKEPALEPELPIVDPHHHLWFRPGWRYMLDDFLADTCTGHNIVATVFAQAHSMYRDSRPLKMHPSRNTPFLHGLPPIS